VTAIAPTIVPRGTVVNGTITGVNLTGAYSVIFSGTGVIASILSGGSSTSVPISISIDPSATFGMRTVSVSAIGGISSPFSGLTIAPPPTITGITPNSGAPGTSVAATIDGVDLTGASSVSFLGSGVTASIPGGGTLTSVPVTVFITSSAPVGPHAF